MDSCIQSNGDTIPHSGHWDVHTKGSLSLQGVMINQADASPITLRVHFITLSGRPLKNGIWPVVSLHAISPDPLIPNIPILLLQIPDQPVK